jgi:hypothetical protein
MSNVNIDQITLVYRGETQQFHTVSQAAHFLRQVRIKVGWFHKIKAAVDLTTDDKASQTRHLKGDKYHIMEELEQLDNGSNPSHD